MNCLNQAIAEERIHQVRLLLSMNVDPEYCDKNDENRAPLIKAARLDCEDSGQKIMKILLKAGVNINTIDDLAKTPLHYACNNGKSKIVQLLLNDDSIKLNEKDKESKTPLMLAVINGHYKVARMLILKLTKFDLEMDLRDSKGYTALLLAIKNHNYDIACDLVRYGNACSTIRDNEEFKNAPEWLKKTLGDVKIIKAFTAENRVRKKKSQTQQNKNDRQISDDFTDNQSRVLSAVPLLTVSNLPDSVETEGSVVDMSISDMVTAMKQAVANSGLLFEPEPYRSHSRPPSSVLSKVSLTSSKNIPNKQIVVTESLEELSEQGTNTRPSTGTENKSYQNTLTPATKKIASELESTAERSLLSASSVNQHKRSSQILKSNRGKLASAKKPATDLFKVDLGSINISPREYSYSQSNTKDNLQIIAIKDLPAKDMSATNLASSIQALRQALKDQKRMKISRSSTALSYAYPALSKNDESLVQVRPNTTAPTAEQSRAATRKTDKGATKGFNVPSNISIRSFLSQSNVSEDLFTNNYRQPSSIERSKRNIRTLFSLYTDSLLRTPVPSKSASLSVQGIGNESDKLTLASDLTTSVSDLASIIEHAGSIAPSEDTTNSQLQGKPQASRSKIMSGSATSRASKKSARISSSRNSSAYLR